MTTPEHLRSELLADLGRLIAHVLKKRGIPALEAHAAATAAIDRLVAQWAGQEVYIPSDYAFKIAQRDAEILRRLKREGPGALATEYGISRAAVLRGARRARARATDEAP